MKLTTRVFAFLALASLAAAALPAGVVGTWKGKVTVDTSKAPKPTNPQQQKSMDAGLAMLKKLEIILNVKPNKTFVVDAKNIPGKPAPERSEGTWKQEKNVLWLTSVKDNGKPAKDKKPQKFLILDGGRKLSLTQEGMPPWVKVVFTR